MNFASFKLVRKYHRLCCRRRRVSFLTLANLAINYSNELFRSCSINWHLASIYYREFVEVCHVFSSSNNLISHFFCSEIEHKRGGNLHRYQRLLHVSSEKERKSWSRVQVLPLQCTTQWRRQNPDITTMNFKSQSEYPTLTQRVSFSSPYRVRRSLTVFVCSSVPTLRTHHPSNQTDVFLPL